ncbi:MAG: DUF285 domain-containing protein [archaeon]|nr:DUF285 domain-containing protein [archaeon]
MSKRDYDQEMLGNLNEDEIMKASKELDDNMDIKKSKGIKTILVITIPILILVIIVGGVLIFKKGGNKDKPDDPVINTGMIILRIGTKLKEASKENKIKADKSIQIISKNYKGITKENAELLLDDKPIDFSDNISVSDSLSHTIKIKVKGGLSTLKEMFSECIDLKEVSFEKLDTENSEDMKGMFKGCAQLEKVDFNDLKTEKVKDMSEVFSDCSKLNEISFGSLSTKEVKTTESMFNNCVSLDKINLRTFDFTNIEKVTNMFKGLNVESTIILSQSSYDLIHAKGDSGLEKALPVLYDNSVLYIGTNLLRLKEKGINSLENITLISPEFNEFNENNVEFYVNGQKKKFSKFLITAEYPEEYEFDIEIKFKFVLTTFKNLFKDCNEVAQIDITKVYTEEITSTEGMFSGCTFINTFNISNLNTAKVTSMAQMFQGCSNTNFFDIDKFDTRNVLSMREMFDGIYLNSLDISNFNVENCQEFTNMFGGQWYTYVGNLTLTNATIMAILQKEEIPFFDNVKNVNILTAYAVKFLVSEREEGKEGKNDVKTLLGDKFDQLNEGNCYMYDNGHSIGFSKTYNLESGLHWIEYRFDEKLLTTAYMFAGAHNSFEYDFSQLDTSSVVDMTGMFYDNEVNELNLTNFNTENVLSMESMFEASGIYRMDISSFNLKNVKTMKAMFKDMRNLRELDLSKLNTEKVTNMESLFEGCEYITSLNLGMLRTKQVENMSSMFRRFAAYSTIKLDLNFLRVQDSANCSLMFDGFNTNNEIHFNIKNYLALEKKLQYETFYDLKTVMDYENCITIQIINGLDVRDKLYTLIADGFNLINDTNAMLIRNETDKMPNVFKSFKHYLGAAIYTFEYYFKGQFENMTGMFEGTNFDKIDISLMDGGSNKYLDKMFYKSEVKEVYAKGFLTENLITMNYAFADCEYLKKIEGLDLFFTFELKELNYAFSGLKSMEKLDFTRLYCFNAESMEGIFEGFGANVKTELDISNVVVDKLTNSKNMFNNFSTKEGSTLRVSEFVHRYLVEYGDTKIETVPNIKFLQVILTMVNFQMPPSAKKNNLKEYKIQLLGEKFDLFNKDNTKLYVDFEEVEFTKTLTVYDDSPVKSQLIVKFAYEADGKDFSLAHMFDGTNNVYSFLFYFFDVSNVTDMTRMFAESNAEEVDFEHFNTKKVTSMEQMFYKCEGLRYFTLNSFSNDVLSSTKGMFQNCGSLEELPLNNFKGENVADVSEMFADCQSLRSIDLCGFNFKNSKTMTDMFRNKNEELRLTIDEDQYNAITDPQKPPLNQTQACAF